MASPLGTLLIQRLDSALGNALSQQTRIASRGGIDIITQPGEADRQEQITNRLVRHQQETLDKSSAQVRQQGRGEVNQATTRTLTHAGSNMAGMPTPSAPTTLGGAARIILHLLANHTPGNNAIQARAPLVTNPTSPAAVTQMANALSQSIQQSGLFYESHLKELTLGNLRLSDLQLQPQNTLTKPAASPNQQANTANSGQPTTTPAASQATTQNPANIAQQINAAQAANTNQPASVPGQSTQEANQNTQQTAQATASSSNPTPGVEQSTHNLVRMQLETLADQFVQWRGEAWPGAEVECRIQRKEEDESGIQAKEQNISWQSSINLHLPVLGNINATIGLGGKNVFIQLQASEENQNLLQHHADNLAQNLDARELQLALFKITNPDSNDSADP